MLKRVTMVAVAAALLAAGCWSSDPVAERWEQPTRFREAEGLYLAQSYPMAKAKFLTVANSEVGSERMFADEARYYAARCDQNLGNYVDAVKVYNQLLEGAPYRSLEIRALVSRGDISMEVVNRATGIPDYAGAVHDYGRARNLLGPRGQFGDVDSGRVIFSLGKAYRGQAVSSRDPEEREAKYRQADKCFDEYMNLYPTGPFAEEARRLNSRTTGLAPVTTFYLLVGGSSTVRDQADVVARRLRAKGYQPEVFSENQAGSTVYRVRVGSYETNRAAVLKAAQLRAAGFDVEVRP